MIDRTLRMIVFSGFITFTAVIAYNLGQDSATLVMRSAQMTADSAIFELDRCIGLLESTAELLSRSSTTD